MFSTCASAVRGATDSREAMARLVSPSATSPATSSSRRVSGAGPGGLAEEAERGVQDRLPFALVEEVARPGQRDQHGPGDQRGHLRPSVNRVAVSCSRCSTAVRAWIAGSSDLMSVP